MKNAYTIKKAYITGVTGTIGMALLETLLDAEVDTEVFIRPTSPSLCGLMSYRDSLEPSKKDLLSIVKANLSELAELHATANDGISVFFHLGWMGTTGAQRNDVSLQELNVKYSIDAVELAHRLGCTAFIGAGSQAEYGPVSGRIDENTMLNPVTEYGRAKHRAMTETLKLCRRYGMTHTWTRILSVYGPYNADNTMVMLLVDSLLDGRKASLTMGEQVWDYLYCKDAAEALLLIAKAGNAVNEKIYCIGSGEGRRLSEYIKEICDACDADESLLGFGEVAYTDNQVMYLVADISKIRDELGFVPRYSFAEGIRETVKWKKEKRSV